MELLLSKLDEKLNQQTKIITASVTQCVMEALDERLKTIVEENTQLKAKISSLEQKISVMDKEKRKYNLVFFGLQEAGKSEAELVDYIKETVIETGTPLNSQEISNIYRIGKKDTNENRPVIVSITSMWKKHIILKNKRGFPPGIFVKEDFPKEILEKRKQLQTQVIEEKKKGNVAYLKYDKIIVKKPTDKSRDKRKREESGSPNSSTQKKINSVDTQTSQTTKGTPKEIISTNILNYVARGRTSSLSDTPKNL